ncbi:unnamed protein product [Cladocopium goreaui]|uniref:Sodium channel protein type 11 subunit alpha n=1 Tax=Cladocopium goreaui TaxID=2562237 RepID=A0A9P1BZN4_9DINO|nr:unnamed protein product [Cladocopium goreaui]
MRDPSDVDATLQEADKKYADDVASTLPDCESLEMIPGCDSLEKEAASVGAKDMKLILDELAPLAGEETQYMMRAEALLSVPHAPDGAALVPRAVVQSTLSAINIALEKVQGVIDRTTPSAQQELEETEALNAARKAELGVPIEPRHPDEDNQEPSEDQEMEMLAELEVQEMQMDDGTEGQKNESTNESQEAQDDEENITPCSKTTPKAKSGASKASAKKRPRAKPTAKAQSKSCKKPAKNAKKASSAKKGKPKKTDDPDVALKKKLHSTLVWSFVFCFVVMTVWAMLLVEIVNPLIQELLEKDPGIFNECEHCTRATSSVMKANLLLFKTVIAGDSWGRIAVPVIEAYPATAIIFVGSQLTLVFGVLNLIVAVVVDTFADSRERDILNLAEEMEQDRESDKQYLERIFNRIDLDGCGQLSLEQLVEGARKDQEFQSRLRVMDIDEADLVQLFDMIDTDGSGFIEPNEFIKPLSRWVHDSKTAPRFIKYNMMRLMNEQHEIREGQASLRKSMEKHFAEMARRLGSQQVSSSKMDDSERSVGDATKIDDSVGIATELLESLPLAPAGFPMESEYTATGPEAAMSELETMEQPPSSQPVMLWPSRATEEAEAEVQAAVGRLEELLKHTADPAFKESIANINEMLLDMRKLRQAEEPAPGPAPRVHAAVHPQLHQCASAPNDGSEKKATDRRSPGLLPSVKGNFQRIESM